MCFFKNLQPYRGPIFAGAGKGYDLNLPHYHIQNFIFSLAISIC